ncbi:MAG: phosphoribosylaminoimidazolesuccinocarboxamide synthase [Bdellovibrionaceae bacterium]|nr:phosphoribosylaminoimidazolesuccinocarboxamide synthase [Bdellovibrio sp.]
MLKKELLYEGKAKKIFKTENDLELLMEYKDSLTAFNALKKGEFAGKGALNCKISTLIFETLSKNQVKHHWLKTLEGNQMLVQKTTIIPLEVVVRNVIAGSLAKKLGRKEGETLVQPLVEFYYKDDALADPFVSDDQIVAMGWADLATLEHLKKEAGKINQVLKSMFEKIGLKLVDFKTEFGRNAKQEIILADEISPDCMRLWDLETNKKMDKDRFRQDLGEVEESYQEVYQRLQKGTQI